MMRSVINEGTAARRAAPASRSTRPARRAPPTTCATRGSSGFTPELLTVVWVGFDDNQVLGLSGSQAALPIWTSFMNRALAGHPNLPLPEPDGIVCVEIDRDNGQPRRPRLPAHVARGVRAGHRADRALRAAQVLTTSSVERSSSCIDSTLEP